MANGDIPVEGSAVGSSGRDFIINAKDFAEDGRQFLEIRTTPGKKLHIFVDADLTNPGTKIFDEDVNNDKWKLIISET